MQINREVNGSDVIISLRGIWPVGTEGNGITGQIVELIDEVHRGANHVVLDLKHVSYSWGDGPAVIGARALYHAMQFTVIVGKDSKIGIESLAADTRIPMEIIEEGTRKD